MTNDSLIEKLKLVSRDAGDFAPFAQVVHIETIEKIIATMNMGASDTCGTAVKSADFATRKDASTEPSIGVGDDGGLAVTQDGNKIRSLNTISSPVSSPATPCPSVFGRGISVGVEPSGISGVDWEMLPLDEEKLEHLYHEFASDRAHTGQERDSFKRYMRSFTRSSIRPYLRTDKPVSLEKCLHAVNQIELSLHTLPDGEFYKVIAKAVLTVAGVPYVE